MVERESREQAEERILVLQDELVRRLEANPLYQSMSPEGQMQALEMMMPQLFDPKYEIGQLLKSIQTNKYLITQYNRMAIQHPTESEQWAEAVTISKELIQYDLAEIKRIKKGDFEWVS